MKNQTDEILDIARSAGRQAARVCRQVQARIPTASEAMAKVGKEPVTVADYASQALILRQVQASFPEHGVIAEEGAEHLRGEADEDLAADIVALIGQTIETPTSFDEVCSWIDHRGGEHEFTWVIDPIDGTKGFLRRDQYAVAIGLLRQRRLWSGVLVCPNLPLDLEQPEGEKGVLFVASRGRGVLRESLSGDQSLPVRVSTTADPAQGRILGSVESAHGDPQVMTSVIEEMGLAGVVRLDSQAKYGMVAGGGAEIYLRPQSRPDYREKVWDHAAGALVIEEAGGRVSDLDGRALDFSLGPKLIENRGVVATNGHLHERLLESLARVGA